MARRYKSYIKEWREYRGLKRAALVDLLLEQGASEKDGVPTTEVSLWRIEKGEQNFKIALLEALATALDIPEPGWLLHRNPYKAGEIVSLIDRLDEGDQQRAAAVLEAMFGRAG